MFLHVDAEKKDQDILDKASLFYRFKEKSGRCRTEIGLTRVSCYVLNAIRYILTLMCDWRIYK